MQRAVSSSLRLLTAHRSLPASLARAANLEGLLAAEPLEVVYEARSGALRELLRADAHHLLALLVGVNARLARQSANHAKLLRRDEVGHGLRERVFREVAGLRPRALALDDFTLALVQLA